MFLRKWGKIGTTTPVIGGKYLYLYRSYYAFSLSSRMQGHLCGEEGNGKCLEVRGEWKHLKKAIQRGRKWVCQGNIGRLSRKVYRKIVKVESLFKIDVCEFIMIHYGGRWVTSLDRTWPPGSNTEKMAVDFIQSWSSDKHKLLKYKEV